VFYAGGGAGGGYTAGSLGTAGGGNSNNGTATWVPNQNGLANSGGGGGGVSYGASIADIPGSGGSGIVIIRYPATQSPPASFGGSNYPQILYSDGYQIYIWTASGTVTF
jgi:hypothetical protein